jgi:hypothetical protein
MLKKFALIAFVASICALPVQADEQENPWTDTAGNGAETGNKAAKTDKIQPYEHEDKGRKTIGEYGFAQETKNQAFTGKPTSNGGPVIMFGKNTFWAPSNMASMTENHSSIGKKLPKTTLDSFVHKAKQNGMADLIYGDEGRKGPPPHSFFMTIQSGGVQATTGHPSDAPSAWY